MLTLRRSQERGHAQHGWLDSFHTFSFANYHDPKHMGFRSLRVINDDTVAGGSGFGEHPHRDMEIITYVLSGALTHRDSMGTGSTLRHGDVQRMSAGTGVTHSEVNASPTESLHLLQIWLLPEKNGLKPSYEEKRFPSEEKRGRLRLVASPDARDGSITVHQDARLYAALLDGSETAEFALAPERHVWLHVARGSLEVNGQSLQGGDAVAASREPSLRLANGKNAEVLLFDLG